MPVKLRNTLTSSIDELRPINDSIVTIYGCGPTVYDYMHIGNLRTFIFNDLLVRTLKYSGYAPKFIQNITDIDDKIIKRSTEKNMTPPELAEEYTKAFFADLSKLNIIPADNYPKASEHLGEMIKYIEKLMEEGIAYKEEDGSIYFDISKFSSYGKLSHLENRQLKSGTRILSDEYSKDDVQDFALWKSVNVNEYGYDSPWGKGRPGWHIECSVMSQEYLGKTLDIHTGAVDLIFPHHENEIAQSESLTGQTFANFFVHAEHLLVDGAKMSKSLGNFYTLKDLEAKEIEPLAFRYLLLTAHYRDKLNFTFESVQGAQNALNNLRDLIQDLPIDSASTPDQSYQQFLELTQDDLKLPQALAVFWTMVKDQSLSPEQKSANIQAMDQILGLSLSEWMGKTIEIPKNVLEFVAKRETAKAEHNFELADALRKHVLSLGFQIDDTVTGSVIKPAK
jgi:cysteinyl-tRNA synthetase